MASEKPVAPPTNEEPVSFRAPRTLRWLLVPIGALSLLAALIQTGLAISQQDWRRLGLAGVLMLPPALAAATQRRRIEVGPAELRCVTLLSDRHIPWTRIRHLDQMRRSFVVETEMGSVSAAWIEPRERDRLFRLVLQYGKLVMAPKTELRYGIRARFVPRQQPIRLERKE